MACVSGANVVLELFVSLTVDCGGNLLESHVQKVHVGMYYTRKK